MLVGNESRLPCAGGKAKEKNGKIWCQEFRAVNSRNGIIYRSGDTGWETGSNAFNSIELIGPISRTVDRGVLQVKFAYVSKYFKYVFAASYKYSICSCN